MKHRNKDKPSKFSSIGNVSLDSYLVRSPAPPVVRAANSSTAGEPLYPAVKTRTVNIGFSMGMLQSALDSVPKRSKCEWSCLKRLTDRGWLCTNGQEIVAVNSSRLYEMVLFDQLSGDEPLPSKLLDKPIEINQR